MLTNTPRFYESLNQLLRCSDGIICEGDRGGDTRTIGTGLGDSGNVGGVDAADGDDGSRYMICDSPEGRKSCRACVGFRRSAVDRADRDVVCAFFRRGDRFVDKRVGFPDDLMRCEDGPTFGDGEIVLSDVYAVSPDFGRDFRRVVDDEDRVVVATDISDVAGFLCNDFFCGVLVAQLDDRGASGRGSFSDGEYVPTSTVVGIDDHVDAANDFGGSWTNVHEARWIRLLRPARRLEPNWIV